MSSVIDRELSSVPDRLLFVKRDCVPDLAAWVLQKRDCGLVDVQGLPTDALASKFLKSNTIHMTYCYWVPHITTFLYKCGFITISGLIRIYSVLVRISLFTSLLVTWYSSLMVQILKKIPAVVPETSATNCFPKLLTAQHNERFIHMTAET